MLYICFEVKQGISRLRFPKNLKTNKKDIMEKIYEIENQIRNENYNPINNESHRDYWYYIN